MTPTERLCAGCDHRDPAPTILQHGEWWHLACWAIAAIELDAKADLARSRYRDYSDAELAGEGDYCDLAGREARRRHRERGPL